MELWRHTDMLLALYYARKMRRMTQPKLAGELGSVSQATVSRWQREVFEYLLNGTPIPVPTDTKLSVVEAWLRERDVVVPPNDEMVAWVRAQAEEDAVKRSVATPRSPESVSDDEVANSLPDIVPGEGREGTGE